MKTLGIVSIVLAIVCVVSFGIAIALGPVLLFNGFESQSVNQFEKASISGVDELKIDLLDTELQVYPVYENEFEFTLTGTYAKNDYENSIELSVEKIGSVLDVTINYPEWLVLINRDLDLAVGVPESYYGKLKVEVSSGDVDIKNLKTKEFEIVTLSGEIDIYNIENSGESFVKSSSGDIKINEFKSQISRVESLSGEVSCGNIDSVDSFSLETTSGDIFVRNLLTEYSEFKSLSGEIEIEDSRKINSVTTTSGDVNIKNLEIHNDLKVKTLSGGVDLDFVDGSLIDLDFDSLSGDLDNSFGDISEGDNKVYVKTTSGDLNVY